MTEPAAHLEIERKYLLARMPDLPEDAQPWKLRQGYLPLEGGAQGDDHQPGRIREKTRPDGAKLYTHTSKSGSGLTRKEVERPLDADEFERLWASTEGRRIIKTRHRVPIEAPDPQSGGSVGLIWEIDEFDGFDLVFAEVEIPREDFPVEIPAWLAPVIVREVTHDPRFTNARIALEGVPRD